MQIYIQIGLTLVNFSFLVRFQPGCKGERIKLLYDKYFIDKTVKSSSFY